MARRLALRDFNNLLVGAMLMGSLAIITVGGLLTLRNKSDMFEEVYVLHTIFDQGLGLQAGTKVKINGVPIGKVSSVSLTPSGKVELTLEIQRKFQQHITTESKAYPTRDQNLISDRIILVTHGDSGETLDNDGFIRSDEAQDIEALVMNANELMGRAMGMFTRVDSILTLMTDTTRTLGSLIGTDHLYRNIDKQLDNVDHITSRTTVLLTDMNDKVPRLLDRADTLTGDIIKMAGKGVQSMDALDTLVRTANGSVEQVDLLLQRANNLMVTSEDKLENADDLMRSLSDMWFVRRGLPDRSHMEPLPEEAW
jgi:phospholipid/cholesterol/gamma-HCH transport system substrate-binding protein